MKVGGQHNALAIGDDHVHVLGQGRSSQGLCHLCQADSRESHGADVALRVDDRLRKDNPLLFSDPSALKTTDDKTLLRNSFLKIQAIPDEFALAPAGGVAAHMSVKTDDAKIGIAQYLRVQKL